MSISRSPRANSTAPVLSVRLNRARSIFAMGSLDYCKGGSTRITRLRKNGGVPHHVTLIPGDGIGPEVADAAVRVVEATGVEIVWHRTELTGDIIAALGVELPPMVLDSLDKTRTGLKGPVTTPIAGGFKSVNVALRKKLDLFANVRPVKMLPGLKTRFSDVDVDMVIFRENTEDLYSGLEHEVVTDVVESLKIITRTASVRIARYAFAYARRHGRKKVTAVHKANIMKLSDGLFIRCAREVAEQYPEIEYKELIVDNAAMQLVMRPETFDVLLLPNLYGDIVSDLAAGLVGGLGIVPGANMGESHAVFEAVHGSAPDIAGRGIANPTALIQSAIMMLRHLGETDAADRVQKALAATYGESKSLTRDVGGSASTAEFTDAVISYLR
jgi:isocitrate dehydrogenase (NAD+)